MKIDENMIFLIRSRLWWVL